MNYFFIGIKGSGMSSLAAVLKDMGNNVAGSDVPTHYFTEDKLKKKQIKIYDFGVKEFKEFSGTVILGNAFNEEHIDYQNAKSQKLEIISYATLLNNLVTSLNSIAIAGTNGKTTTTGLTKEVLKHKEISYLIGDGTGVGNSKSEYFVFEACEYQQTFLNYTPKYAIVNNIEFDHPDYFKDLAHVIESFQLFVNKVKTLIINGDDCNCQTIKHENKVTFGQKENNTLRAESVEYLPEGIQVKLQYQEKNLGTFILPFYGEHMLYNALAAICMGLVLNQPIELIIRNLQEFSGVSRRFSEETLNQTKEVVLIDDYAHHGTAIKLTIEAIRQKYPDRQLTVIFQPHTFSRTSKFKKEFAKSLVLADKIIVTDVFGSAREQEANITSEVIIKEINKLASHKTIEFSKLDTEQNKQVICLLGAGDIDLLYKEKIKKLFK
ncbi:MAG: UDP-N-acetylmuramate--L-alanine ligase [Mycoplasmatales bacterium]